MLICLIGYRGTGKTTVGQVLASQLNVTFVDTDATIQEHTGKTISEIFAQEGEGGFRDVEAEVIAGELKQTNKVISLGGGAVLRESTRALLKHSDHIIWLQASVSLISSRLAADPVTASLRPSLTNLQAEDEIEEILTQRTPLYQECATLEIDTENKSPSEVVDEIMKVLPLRHRGGNAR